MPPPIVSPSVSGYGDDIRFFYFDETSSEQNCSLYKTALECPCDWRSNLCQVAPVKADVPSDVLKTLQTVCAPIATRIKVSSDTRPPPPPPTPPSAIDDLENKCPEVLITTKATAESYQSRLKSDFLRPIRTPPCDLLYGARDTTLQSLLRDLIHDAQLSEALDEALALFPEYLFQPTEYSECNGEDLHTDRIDKTTTNTINNNVGYQTNAFDSSLWHWISFVENYANPPPNFFQWFARDDHPDTVDLKTTLSPTASSRLLIRGNPNSECLGAAPPPPSLVEEADVCARPAGRFAR